jgi:hypothetical protein
LRRRHAALAILAAAMAAPALGATASLEPGDPVPAPELGDRPGDPSSSGDARFTFTAQPGVRFDCRLDGAPPERCESPRAYSRLAEGEHRFSVTARRGTHQRDATAVYAWLIDVTAPSAPAITGRPDALSDERTGALSFSAAEPGTTLRCSLDEGSAADCTSPYRFADLPDGPHAFAVYAVDRAGNAGPREAVSWTIDATAPPAPVLTGAPDPGSQSARFEVAEAESGARVSCRLDDGPAQLCPSPVDYADLAPGAHRFEVTARDAAGNGSTAAREWFVALRPEATTGGAEDVAATAATVTGSVRPESPAAVSYFEYGPDAGYGSRTPAVPVAGAAAKATLTGLEPTTTYHYRLVVTTCGGCAPGTARGADATLDTRAVGSYQNPVYGGQPDPMAARGSEYYVYGTGERFPIVRSNDLVHWTRAGTAMNRRPDWVPQDGQWNPWAPSVIERAGACPGTTSASCWLMYYTGLNRRFNLPDGNNCIGVAVSTSPAGPFTDTGILDTAPATTDSSGRPIGCGDDAGHSNIDAAPFVDPVSGDAYLYLSTGRNADHVFQRTVSVIPLTGDMLHAADARRPLFTMTQPWELDVVEAPWMLRHGGTYYLLYSGGRFSDASYAMGYAIASSPTGPFTKALTNPFLAGKEDVVGPGGGSVVVGPHGGDWLIYHGRAVAGGARTLRVDPLVWDDAHDLPTLGVRGPTTDPQPLP